MCSLTYVGYFVSNHVFVVVDSGKGNLLLLWVGRHHKQPLKKKINTSSGRHMVYENIALSCHVFESWFGLVVLLYTAFVANFCLILVQLVISHEHRSILNILFTTIQ